jgi:hypothetical protein
VFRGLRAPAEAYLHIVDQRSFPRRVPRPFFVAQG